MGKRATTTTKGGKYMNPTDQARKEARKRELKKNKKQRQAVRSAVLKGKNPREIIQELEKIDDMEYNVHAPPPLGQKVLGEKRRKLAETWERVIKMYEKDLPEQWAELRKLWTNYQSRKIEVVKYYESVKNAQAVTVDEIPLPNMSSVGFDENEGAWEEESSIPLPPPPTIAQAPPKSSILKKPSIFEVSRPKLCPGVPAGAPPPIEDYQDVAPLEAPEARKRTIRFGDEPGTVEEGPPGAQAVAGPNNLQKKMLEMAGQDLDQFMKEMEEVHRQREAEKAADLQQRLARLDNTEPAPPGMEGTVDMDPAPPGVNPGPPGLPTGPPGAAPPGPPPGVPPMLYRPSGHPPPLRPGVPPPGVRLPPGPPPGRLPPSRPSGPPSVPRPSTAPSGGHRPPPGPPSGAPPRGARPNMPKPLGVVSAKPQLNKPSEIKTGKVIESAPVMRNLRSDITRFVPTNLRIKREDTQKSHSLKRKAETGDQQKTVFNKPKQSLLQQQQPTKDDAYAQFMAEMSNLL